MIGDTISEITRELPQGARLVAVSKYNPVSSILEAYEAGQRLFGESHVQEMEEKRKALATSDIEWHFIGHLQRNKVKYIAPYVALIHAVDSPRLLEEVSRQGLRCGRRVPCLLELHVAREETKYGFSPQECQAYLEGGSWRGLEGVEIRGLMCMASNVDDEGQIAREFETAHQLFLRLRGGVFKGEPSFSECSWGMSHDYQIALRHGSTLVRVGSKIFGERVY